MRTHSKRPKWAKAGHPGRGLPCHLCAAHCSAYVGSTGGFPMFRFRVCCIVTVVSLLFGSAQAEVRTVDVRTVKVAGSGVDFLTTALVHSKEPTATGMIQKSTETVELTGDLTGRVLY